MIAFAACTPKAKSRQHFLVSIKLIVLFTELYLTINSTMFLQKTYGQSIKQLKPLKKLPKTS